MSIPAAPEIIPEPEQQPLRPSGAHGGAKGGCAFGHVHLPRRSPCSRLRSFSPKSAAAVDVEAGAPSSSSLAGRTGTGGVQTGASAAPPGPTLAERFTTLFKRLRRQADSVQHERVPSSDSTGQPTVAVVTEGEPASASPSGSATAAAAAAALPGSPRLGRANSGSKERVCLICLDPLLEEDFRSGRAISLQCACRGDLAVRHRECAVKWVQVRGPCRQIGAGLPRHACTRATACLQGVPLVDGLENAA